MKNTLLLIILLIPNAITFAHGDYSDDFGGINPVFAIIAFIVLIAVIGILVQMHREKSEKKKK